MAKRPSLYQFHSHVICFMGEPYTDSTNIKQQHLRLFGFCCRHDLIDGLQHKPDVVMVVFSHRRTPQESLTT